MYSLHMSLQIFPPAKFGAAKAAFEFEQANVDLAKMPPTRTHRRKNFAALQTFDIFAKIDKVQVNIQA